MRRRLFLFLTLILTGICGIHGQRVIKIACVGNSITYGSGIENRDQQSYPAQLQYWLGKDYQVENFGVSGATLLKNGDRPYWKLEQFQEISNFGPDIIILKLGTNDSKPQNWKFASEFKKDYQEMVNHFKGLASRPRVLLATPAPVFQENPFGISKKIVAQEIVPAIKEIASKSYCDLIDLHEALKDAEAHFPDKVHPDPIACEMMVKEIYFKLFHKSSANNGKGFNTAIHAVPSPEYRGAPAGWGKGKDWFSQHNDINEIGKNRSIDLVFLGNSITQSWGGDGRSVGSPVKALWDSLYAPRNAANFGISGDRTQHILWRIDNGNFDEISPKAVVVTIGVNNFNSNSANEITAGIKRIVKKLKTKLPKTQIILHGPLPTGKNPQDERRIKFMAIHKQLQSLGTQTRVNYLPIMDPFILENGKLDYRYMRTDNIHITPQGYYAWADKLEPLLKEIFND